MNNTFQKMDCTSAVYRGLTNTVMYLLNSVTFLFDTACIYIAERKTPVLQGTLHILLFSRSYCMRCT